jgi:hypothetical protein
VLLCIGVHNGTFSEFGGYRPGREKITVERNP